MNGSILGLRWSTSEGFSYEWCLIDPFVSDRAGLALYGREWAKELDKGSASVPGTQPKAGGGD
ncbi:MAG: hypothetical protein OEZ57_15560 [Nitrospirota bacterium]|nr:hypothetical protein [Nitrospirota bacterium]MDH5776322.1 hypothetical protein [Nitrospirota bacterium]